mmetsp:Transcript_3990/g.11695  ORF Transcript_3990/g.11695 Transcript_3990/m.11695 type:complete len:221 (-) Transcript_3990:18-680(-)
MRSLRFGGGFTWTLLGCLTCAVASSQGIVQNCLEEWVRSGEVRMTDQSNQKVYWFNQALYKLSDSNLSSVQKEVEELKENQQELSESLQSMEAELQSLEATPTNTDLPQLLAKEEKDVKGLRARADKLRSSGIVITPAEKERKTKNLSRYRSEWVKRKRLCMDMVHMIADGMEKRPKEVQKLIGIETDEDVQVTLPPADKAPAKALTVPRKRPKHVNNKE